MGNCLKCFQSSSSENPPATIRTNLSNTSQNCQNIIGLENCNNDNSNNANDRQCNDKWQETDELLSSNGPYNNTNNCDTKRNSFKKSSLVLLNGNTAMSDIKTCVVQSSHEVSEKTLNKLFEEYRDEKEEDMILAEGIEKLCHDLNYQPDEFQILVLAWCLDAAQMCCFTRTEFMEGLHKICADNIPTIRLRLEQTTELLKTDAEMFKQLYRFTFRFGLEPDQRTLSLDMAISLWKLVFTVRPPELLDNWIFFLEQNPSIRGIQKDTWYMFLNFSEQCDIENYDDTEAWPSLFDDFVDYEKARLVQLNATAAAAAAAAAAATATTNTTATTENSNSHDDDNNNDDPLQRNSKSLQIGNIL